jgi:hypothetical protein
MRPRTLWPEDPLFIEVGVRDADLALGLRREGYRKYLGVSGDARRIARLQAQHPELSDQLTASKRRKLVLNNNANVIILSGSSMLSVWSYRSVRHAQWVAWRFGFNLFSLVALLGCLWHLVSKRYSWPRLVTLQAPGDKSRRLFVARILRQKNLRRNSLHFIPHSPGLTGLFRQFDQRGVRHVVLRWFESLPEIEPTEDVDLLVDDRSLSTAIEIFESLPGIQPCDVYSESGLARSAYCGTPYYPPQVARRILDGAVRHKNLCLVPNPWDYFHSLAYHAVYHKGPRSNLARSATGLPAKGKPEHDYAGILREMADRLGINVEMSLEGLHAYLQETGWGPPPEMLARLAVACWRNKWLEMLAERLPPLVHDQGLTVFVLREEAVQRGLQDRIVDMIQASGFEILATRVLSPGEVEHAAARTRGGNWVEEGPFDMSGGSPAIAVVAYDRSPIPVNRRQRRRFRHRTNARIFVKESIRDAIVAHLPAKERFNALHSSDHAAEAWHLIEVLAPELLPEIRARLQQIHAAATAAPSVRRAA